MRISLRILLGYFVIVGVAAGFVLSVFQQEVKPGVRQALEDSLVDSANLLAELAAPELAAGTLGDGRIAAALAGYRARPIDVQIWDHRKRSPDLRVYVTDRAGIVVFDSAGTALGQDYSRWNDVYLTLQGRYGARSSPASAGDPEDTLMHVAAPVEDPSGAIIGVLTVVRANRTVAPIVARSERRIRRAGYTLVGLSLVLGVLFTWRLTRSIHRLRDYARAVADGAVVSAPASAAAELAQLGQALETMRRKIDGRQYVEEYVHALTHELKSPLPNCCARTCRRRGESASWTICWTSVAGCRASPTSCWTWPGWSNAASSRRRSGSSSGCWPESAWKRSIRVSRRPGSSCAASSMPRRSCTANPSCSGGRSATCSTTRSTSLPPAGSWR